MRRLYLRLYLAVLISLATFAVIAGLVWRLGAEVYGPRDFEPDVIGDLVAELLVPQGAAESDAIERTLDRWHRRARVDITLFDADGRPIAVAGRPVPLPEREVSGWTAARRGAPIYQALLPDGRKLALRRTRQPGGGGGPGGPGLRDGGPAGRDGGPAARDPWPGFFVALVLIALGVGVGAYPVVRRLTRRLERLQASVDALGAGDLSTRVSVEGRDEVASLASSFNRSAQRIEALMQAQKDLLANASHELRSPMARLRMAVELLSPQASVQVREEMNRDIAELDQLIDEILLASRLDAQSAGLGLGSAAGAGAGAEGGAAAGGAAVESGAQAEEVDLIGLCAEECVRAGAEFSIVTGAGGDGAEASEGATVTGGTVTGDVRLLRRMVRNLVENALRYGGGKPVEVSLELPGGAELAKASAMGPRLVVADRGTGVPADERERIFEPFYRARGASEVQGGVGLGLSLARRIAGRHGATIECLPREGGGSRFVVAFGAVQIG